MRLNKPWIIVIIVLFLIICVMTWFLVTTPRNPNTVPAVATTTPTAPVPAPAAASSKAPLSASVSVSSPLPNASVGKTFTVEGVAPNGWYNEAVFPIQVRDGDDDLIASGQGMAESDWTVSGPVRFHATIRLSQTYSGPADLILLRDNPSGLPQNEDEVTIPIIID